MFGVLVFLVATPIPVPAEDQVTTTGLFPALPLVQVQDERETHLTPPQRELSKKETWFLEKAKRPPVHVKDADLLPKPVRKAAPVRLVGPPNLQAETHLAEPLAPVGTRVTTLTTLYSMWNHEAVPLIVGKPYRHRFDVFLRCHYTKQWTQLDTRLAGALAAAAIRFRAPKVEIVSGYRSPKYNLVLRKKGHQVARESQHLQGTAIDFRIRGVSTTALRDFIRGLHLGGVGFYGRTNFIHVDTGKIRSWSGS
jgi:hypothetical protein